MIEVADKELVGLKEVSVSLGEIKCSNNPVIFKCSGVGSCVILFIYEARKCIGGVAHIMLPSYGESHGLKHKTFFADTSTGLLIKELSKLGADPTRLRAKIVGGANMFFWAGSEEMLSLGFANITQVKQALIDHRVYLAAEETGGETNKSIRCNLMNGEMSVRSTKNKLKII